MLTSNQQIKYGAALSYVGIFVYILTGLLYTPWMIRTIGRDDYGIYTLANSVITLFVFDFGLSSTIQRFVSKYLAEKNSEKVNRCVSTVCRLYLYIDVLIFIILCVIFFLIPTIYQEFTPTEIERFKIVFVIAGLFSVVSFPFIPLNGILSSHEKFIHLKTCDIAHKVLTIALSITCLYLDGGLYSLVITNAVTGLLAIIFKCYIVKTRIPLKINLRVRDRNETKALLSFSVWVIVVALCQRTIFSVAPSILGIFQPPEVIGIFGIAICLEGYTFTLAYAFNGLFLPKISRILNDKRNVLPLMTKVGRIQIFILGLVLVGFLLVGRQFIDVWLGEAFAEVFYCTLLLILPAFFILPADIADQTLIASGNVKHRAGVYIIMAVVNIPLSFFMTKYYGMKGLAWSIFIAYMIRNIALYYVYFTKLHINIFKFFRDSFLKMLPGLTVASVVSYFVLSFVTIGGWDGVAMKVVLTGICYIGIMLPLALNKEEKALFFGIFHRIGKRSNS